MSTTSVRPGPKRARPPDRRPTDRWRHGRPRRTRLWIAGAAALAATVAVISVIALTDGGDESPASAPPLTAAVLPEYRVVYEVRETAGPEPVVTTEVLEVRRPFEARVETWSGAPPGDELLSVTVTNREHFWHVQQAGEVEFGTLRQPGTAHRDASLLALREAVEGAAAEEAGQSTVQGRRCFTFAHRETRPSPLSLPAAGDRVESCVTDDGIVLREVWRFEDRTVLTREAAEVETQPRLDGDRFFTSRIPEPSQERESASGVGPGQAVREGNRLDMPLLRPRLPAGFVADRDATLFQAGGGGLPPHAAYFESFRRRHEVVVVEQGGTPADAPPWSDTEGTAADIPGFASSRVVYFADHVEIRAVLAGDFEEQLRYAVVRAPSSALARYVLEGLAA